MFKEKKLTDDERRTTDDGLSQQLTLSTLCSGELKMKKKHMINKIKQKAHIGHVSHLIENLLEDG